MPEEKDPFETTVLERVGDTLAYKVGLPLMIILVGYGGCELAKEYYQDSPVVQELQTKHGALEKRVYESEKKSNIE